MADFLDTQGLSYSINEIIKSAKKQIYILSPYLRFSQLIFDRLNFATQKEVEVNIIYGKSELHSLELEKLQSLKVNLYFKENLHAKCYANEAVALIGSMNLHQYSEFHNEEMGILISNDHDAKTFKACLDQIHFILGSSKILHKKAISKNNQYEFQPEVFWPLWKEDLRKRYGSISFLDCGSFIKGEHAIMKDVHLSTQYGFITIELPFQKHICKQLKYQYEEKLNNIFSNYRCYWSSPFDRILLYHAKNHTASSLEEDLNYCRQGEKLLVDLVKNMVLNQSLAFSAGGWIPSRR